MEPPTLKILICHRLLDDVQDFTRSQCARAAVMEMVERLNRRRRVKDQPELTQRQVEVIGAVRGQ